MRQLFTALFELRPCTNSWMVAVPCNDDQDFFSVQTVDSRCTLLKCESAVGMKYTPERGLLQSSDKEAKEEQLLSFRCRSLKWKFFVHMDRTLAQLD